MVDLDGEIFKAKALEDPGYGRENICLREQAGCTGYVDVALVKFSKTASSRPVGSPDRLDLVALEEAGQISILGNDPGEGDRQVVAEAEVGQVSFLDLVLLTRPPQGISSVQDPVEQLVPFFPVFSYQGGKVFYARGFNRLEAVLLINLSDETDHVVTPGQLFG